MISFTFWSIRHGLGLGISSFGARIWTCMVKLRCLAQSFRSEPYASLKNSSELAQSKLLFAEQTFVIRRPFKLAVRVDRVYDNGASLILVELKTRSRRAAFETDVIELSAQRVAVMHSTKRNVSEHGYVLVLHPFSRKQSLLRVPLLPEHSVVALANRRKHLLAGLVEPGRPTEHAKCQRCEYRIDCKIRK